ncbi:zinc finger protein 271 isoform X1 [Ooceraea biroi]|uniref:zinc finger protein 271 isoform X1 n=1 Tax=Ooceraea biroi TaxID=2015173 RepID=UPI0009716840|nr:zinc finger protein 271 isoform X1 [Ooceraea biroi]
MESRNSSMLESSREENVLSYETVKSTVTRDDRSELETEEGFLLVSQAQQERYAEEENVDEATLKERTAALAFINLCRICANANDHLIPIFEGDGVERNLAQKILKHLPIRISEDDSLPLQLCYHCATTLLAWHELSEGCLNAERKLLGMQGKQEYDTPAMSLDNLEVPAPITTMETTVNIANSEASEPDQQADDKTEARGTEETDESNRCTRQASSDETEKSRRASEINVENAQSTIYRDSEQEPAQESKKESEEESQRNELFPCEKCSMSFPYEYDLLMHIKAAHMLLSFTCPLCNETFFLPYDMNKHLGIVHDFHENEDFNRFVCDVCGNPPTTLKRRLKKPITHNRITDHEANLKTLAEEFRSKVDSSQTKNSDRINKNSKNTSSLTNDIATDVPAERSSCTNDASSKTHSSKSTNGDEEETTESTETPRSTGDPTAILKILKIRANCRKKRKPRNTRQELGELPAEETHECNSHPREIDKQIADAEEPENDTSTSRLNTTCRFCDKKFHSRKSYWAHRRTHTSEKSYTCHVCGKQFTQSGSLYYHLKHVHDGVKNHACDICGRSFAMKTAMEDHRRIHTGERPYVCDSCGKTFKTKASLYIHGRTHTDEFPHACTYCAKRFRWRQQMLGHLTVHTGEKNHTCDVCGKGFGVKNDLTRHRRVHSDEKPYTCQRCGISFGQKRYLRSHERLKLGTCGFSRNYSRVDPDLCHRVQSESGKP